MYATDDGCVLLGFLSASSLGLGCCVVGSEEKVNQSQLYEREMMLQPSLSFFPSFFFSFSPSKVGSKISSECTIMYVWVIVD